MRRAIYCLFFSLLFLYAPAQDAWDLKRAVDYAIANNISVRQADLQIRFSELNYLQSKSSRLPTLNANWNNSYRFGRSENPTTGILEDANFFNGGLGVQSGVSVFNWFSLKNTIEAGRISAEADKAQAKKAQDDVALNVAVAYLQILLAKEQVKVAGVQVGQTMEQLGVTRKRVSAGSLPELNAVELEAQLARDSSTYISAEASVQQTLLQLKALLNLDAGLSFDVVAPPVSSIPVENLADLQPEAVYALAIQNLPQQKVSELRIQSALKRVEAARGAMYPTLSAFGNLNTNYLFFKKKPIFQSVPVGFQTVPGLRVDAGGTFYPVQQPVFQQGSRVGFFKADPLTDQLSANFGRGIGINIQVPIFNGRQARSNWEGSKLTVQQLQLQNEGYKQTLKQDIYSAYTDATAAIQKYNAARKSVLAAEKAYDFAQKRYNLNLLTTYDLVNTQNNVLRSRIEMLSAQFDYVFKLKLLEFYKGQGLRLQ